MMGGPHFLANDWDPVDILLPDALCLCLALVKLVLLNSESALRETRGVRSF